MKLFALSLALSGLLCVGVGAAETAPEEVLDLVKRTNGQTLSLTLTRDDYETMEGRKGPVLIKIPAFEVKEVLYADRVPKYSTALEKRDEGKLLTAIKYYGMALEEMKDRKWAAEYCNFGIAEALFQTETWQGYKDLAGVKYQPPWHYYQEVIRLNPKSRFLLDAVVRLPVAYARDGKLDEARNALKTAQNSIKQYRTDLGRINPVFFKLADHAQARLTLANAQCLEITEDRKEVEREREYSSALSLYRKAQTDSAGRFPDVYGKALDGELRMMVNEKNFQGALARAEALIQRYEDTHEVELESAIANAYFVKGMAHFAFALESDSPHGIVQSKKEYAEARWAFLHVIVQFFDREDLVARSHFLAGFCCEKRHDLEKDGIERAITHYKSIRTNFPKQAVAEKADEALKRLGAL